MTGKNLMKQCGLLLLSLVLIAGWLVTDGEAARRGKPKAGKFDYYTLVLSWSPTYCGGGGRKAARQCGPFCGSKRGQAMQRRGQKCFQNRHYAFVVHGLWPQYERGWPSYCRKKKNQKFYVYDNRINEILDTIPSKKLVIHQWKKHGICSGLNQKNYFGLTRNFFDRIKIPARYVRPNSYVTTSPGELTRDFTQANDWLKPSMMSVQCGNRKDRGTLREIRFCFTREGIPRSCGANERRACRANSLTLPPVR